MNLKFLRKHSPQNITIRRHLSRDLCRKVETLYLLRSDSSSTHWDAEISKFQQKKHSEDDRQIDKWFFDTFLMRNSKSISEEKMVEESIVKVLMRLNFDDVIKMRLISKKFDKLITENFDYLKQKFISRICLLGSNVPGKLIRYSASFLQTSSQNADKFQNALDINYINRPLRYLHSPEYTFQFMEISAQFLKQLRIGVTNRVQSVELVSCKIKITLQELSILLRIWMVTRFAAIDCEFESTRSGNDSWDKLFTLNSQLTFVHLSFSHLTKINISNRTLSHWTKLNAKSCPESLVFKNVTCNITVSELGIFIGKLLSEKPGILELNKYHLNFGLINCHPNELIDSLKTSLRFVRSHGSIENQNGQTTLYFVLENRDICRTVHLRLNINIL